LPNEMGNLTYLKDLSLKYNNISGIIPSSMSGLTHLEYVNLKSNHLSGTLPDFSNSSGLEYLRISRNDFQFADLEPHFNAINNVIQNNGGMFEYSPMNPVDVELTYDVVYGNDYHFSMPTVNGTGVTYQWYRNDTIIPGATSQTYNITNAQHSDLGDYVCKASSPVIPDLTIDRNVIHLYGPIVQQDRDALIALYNSTDGANWWNNTNWLSTQPVHEWYGVKMRGDRVTEIDLSYNHLNGTIPPEIGDLTNLIVLSLWHNQLTGNIPSELGNLNNLEIFWLDNNQLVGNIPYELSNLTKMLSFWLANNQLSGEIPAGLFDNMPNLYYAAIYGNDSLTGDVDLSNKPNLDGVWFNNTSITTLDVRNSNNAYIHWFYAQNNPILTCVFVDDKNASYLSNWHIDNTAHFVETQAECDAFGVDKAFTANIVVFPNPFNDVISIDVNDASEMENISIRNVQGQTVYSGKFKSELNLSALPAGIYFMHLKNTLGQMAVIKLIKR